MWFLGVSFVTGSLRPVEVIDQMALHSQMKHLGGSTLAKHAYQRELLSPGLDRSLSKPGDKQPSAMQSPKKPVDNQLSRLWHMVNYPWSLVCSQKTVLIITWSKTWSWLFHCQHQSSQYFWTMLTWINSHYECDSDVLFILTRVEQLSVDNIQIFYHLITLL